MSIPDRIWVSEPSDALGYQVAEVADPDGLAKIEAGWREYVATDSIDLDEIRAQIARCDCQPAAEIEECLRQHDERVASYTRCGSCGGSGVTFPLGPTTGENPPCESCGGKGRHFA